MLTLIPIRLRCRWLFVAVALLGAASSPAFGAESPGGAVSAQAKYDATCARCHGAGGRGDGMQAKMVFWMKMPNMANAAYMQTRSDDILFQIIKVGGKAGMPAFGLKLTDPEIKDIVVYIRSFSSPPGQPKPAGATRQK